MRPKHRSYWFATLYTSLTCAIALGQNESPPTAVNNALIVQNTLYQARQSSVKGDAAKAITLLESNLHLINGNREYLSALRDAYWARIQELQTNGQTDAIKAVFDRLKILDPTASLPKTVISDPKQNRPPTEGPVGDDPFQQTPLQRSGARELVRKGADAFAERKYSDAARFFEQANALDPASLGDARVSWAYCRLHQVIQLLNQLSVDRSQLTQLEKEVEESLILAKDKESLVSFGRQVQDRVRDRLRTEVSRGAAPEASTTGWQVVESANFRILHVHTREWAEQLLAVAEKARATQFEKWFGPAPQSWAPRCDIFVYKSGLEYAQATRQPPTSPGHSTIETNSGKVVRRRVDLAGDHVNLIGGGLPHEVTHVVLADLFSETPLPRWADEAMAVLTEPRSHVDRYLRALPRCQKDGTLIPLKQLLTSTEFPEARYITAFYCQSVAVVDLLVAEKDAQSFLLFLRTSQRYGVEKALERSYGIRGFAELQRKLSARMPAD